MYYEYQDNNLFWKNTDLVEMVTLIEKELERDYSYTGPFYLYHKDILLHRLSYFQHSGIREKSNKPEFFYSVKSLSNVSILKIIGDNPLFGMDIVSGGELFRAKVADISPERIVFAGVGKTFPEIRNALEYGIKAFHVESLEELESISRIARSMGKKAGVALRMNPDVSANTHAYISTGKEENKFGIPVYEFSSALEILHNSSSLALVGMQAHIGSQILDVEPYKKTLEILMPMASQIPEELKTTFEYISIGGGFGIDYEHPLANDPDAKEFPVQSLLAYLEGVKKEFPYRIILEPGRFISAYSGLLLTHATYNKFKKDYRITITDSGMSELIRPALYQAFHPILPLVRNGRVQIPHDIVGPICETGDFFLKKYPVYPINPGDRLAIAHSGAYSASMSSNYNSRPMVPEYLLENNSFRIIRKPQTLEDMIKSETSLL